MKIVFHATAAAVATGLVVLVARGVETPAQAPAPVQSTSTGKAALARPRLRDEVPASIRLDGLVAGFGDSAPATLTVFVGGQVVRSQAITLPGYSVDVPASAGNGVVTLAMDAGDVRFTSVVGTYAAIAARAGADRVLTVGEWDAIRLDPVSTAYEYFVSREGGVPQSDIHVETSARSVYGADIATAAALLARLARGDDTLPAGHASGYALLADEAGYAAFLSQTSLSSGDITAEILALPFTAMTADEAARTVALLDGVTDRTAPIVSPLARVMEPAGAGLHHLHETGPRPTFASTLRPSGELELVPTSEVSQWSQSGTCPSTRRPIQHTRTMLGENQRILRRGARQDLRMSLVSYEFTNDCVDYTPYVTTGAGVHHAADLGQSLPWGLARAIEGVRTLPGFCVDQGYLMQCDYAPHSFRRNGVGLATELGAKLDGSMLPTAATASRDFSWYVGAPQALHVSHDAVDVRYWKVDAGTGGATGLVYVASAEIGGETVSTGGHIAAIEGGALQGYGAVSPIGAWKLATIWQVQADYGRPPPTTGHVTRTAAGYSDGWRPATWALDQGRLYETAVSANFSGFHHNCDEAYAAGATACRPEFVRYFRPTARHGARLYGIEEMYVNYSDGYDPPYELGRTSRPTYHELD